MNVQSYTAILYEAGKLSAAQDAVAVETALAIAVNGAPFTVTMQTPGNEAELARGLLYSENVFRSRGVEPVIETTATDQNGFITGLNVRVPPELVLKDFAGNRNVVSVSSCGICGKISLDDSESAPARFAERLDASLVPAMFRRMNAEQPNFQTSGGTHAAAAFTLGGEALCVFEDIGRHNAADKVIGWLLANDALERAQCLTVSGRISYEIVSKAASAGIPFLAAVSAPSTLAIERAQEAGLTLMAFCRGDKFTAYSHPHQLAVPTAETSGGNFSLTAIGL